MTTLANLAVAVCEKLGERGKRGCSGDEHLDSDKTRRHWCYRLHETPFMYERFPCVTCNNRGWLPAILLPEEPCSCPECHGNPVVDTYVCQGKQLCCGGSGFVQRVDEGLLRELLEELGFGVCYDTEYPRESAWRVSMRENYYDPTSGSTLLEAGAKALGVEVRA